MSRARHFALSIVKTSCTPWDRLLVFALLCVVGACGSEPDPLPTVALVQGLRGTLQLSRGGGQEPFETVTRPLRAEQDAFLLTDEAAHGMIDLDNGNWMLLGTASKIQVSLDAVRFERGKLWVDAPAGSRAKIVAAFGELEAEGAAFSVEGEGSNVRVVCASGEVTFRAEGEEGQFVQGESLVFEDGTPTVEATALWDDWTGGLADPAPQNEEATSYVGCLSGRTLAEWGTAFSALPVRSYDARATVQGDYVETVLTQTFFNARSDELETEYTIRLPQGAVVKAFSVNRGNGLERGRIVSMEQGEQYAVPWNTRDAPTGRLVYDGPDQLRARISPIAAGGTVRVMVKYGQWLDRRGAQRTYVLPMRSDGPAPLIGELSIRVDTTRAAAGAFRAGMGAKVDGHEVVFRASDIKPRTDFYLDLIDEKATPGAEVFAYEEGTSAGDPESRSDQNFVLLDVPTDALAEDWEPDAEEPVDLVVLVDTSGGTTDDDLALARASLDALLRLLSEKDRIALRFADVSARVPEGASETPTEVSPPLREGLVEALANAKRGGATDLAASLRGAARLVRGRPNGVVLYVGDGLPTTGALTRTEIHESLAAIADPPRFFALGLGEGVNHGLLRSLFQTRFVHARNERKATLAAAEILATLAQPVLRGVSYSLGEEIERVYPSGALEAVVGSHIRLLGRLRGDLPQHITVRGLLRGKAVEHTFPVVRKSVASNGDIRRRWGTARLAQLLDENAGREALVELGVRFSILTPWTAFVLDGASSYRPVTGFDPDPTRAGWSRSGGAPGFEAYSAEATAGWRRRLSQTPPPPSVALVGSWPQRGQLGTGPVPTGDGGLSRARVRRALLDSAQGPEGCFQRKQLVRPDLAGNVVVELSVSGTGAVSAVSVASSQLGAPDVDRCIEREVAGLRYPATGNAVQIVHTFMFTGRVRTMGTIRECSRASRLELFLRKRLWGERLHAFAGVQGALDLWQRAKLSCELDSWRAKQALLQQLLKHVGPIHQRLALYKDFGEESEERRYLRRLIVQDVTDPREVAAIRNGFGIAPDVDWRVFERDWKKQPAASARLKLVDRWLKVLPDDIDLLLKRLALLQDLERMGEARRLARRLVPLPLSDAQVLTQVGEFWLRQEQPEVARRVFSELVERAPFDPWARMRLGDLYRAHDWHDDAYREYKTLTRLDPSNRGVVLALARAAAGAGRIHEAMQLEQGLAESAEPGSAMDLATVARIWTEIRLAALWTQSEGPAREVVEDRIRGAGILRDPPAVSVLLHWPHPDDRPTLHIRYPGRELMNRAGSSGEEDAFDPAGARAPLFGTEAIKIREREPDVYLFEVRRLEKEQIRHTQGELLVWVSPGTAEAKVLRLPVELTRDKPTVRFRLSQDNQLEVVGTP